MTQRSVRQTRPAQGLEIYGKPSPYYREQFAQRSAAANRPQSSGSEDAGLPPLGGEAGQSSRPPFLSNNPATANIILFKELAAYPNYGNPSGNADILYSRTQGTWTFESPAFLFVPDNFRGKLTIRAVLDDHQGISPNRYSARIMINGIVVHNGRLRLERGVPFGGIFTNWREITCNVPNLRRINQVSIRNTSKISPENWIGIDWMELRLSPRQATAD